MSYSPNPGGLAHRVCTHFQQHPNDKLDTGQIAAKFSVTRSSVQALLHSCVGHQYLLKEMGLNGLLAYGAGKHIARAFSNPAPAPLVPPPPAVPKRGRPSLKPLETMAAPAPAPAPTPAPTAESAQVSVGPRLVTASELKTLVTPARAPTFSVGPLSITVTCADARGMQPLVPEMLLREWSALLHHLCQIQASAGLVDGIAAAAQVALTDVRACAKCAHKQEQ